LNFIVFELSKEYSERVRQRLKRIGVGDPLDGAAEPLVSVPNTANGRRLEDRHRREKPARTGNRKAAAQSKQMRLL